MRQYFITMKCISGRSAEFLCINQGCITKNVFMCSDPHDECKHNHESCSLINLPYLLKKSNHQKPSKNNPSKYQKLKPIQERAKIISSTVSTALTSANMNKEINEMLEEGRFLLPEEKQKITKFMNDRKLDTAQQHIFFKLEKELEEFHRLIIDFQLEMKETREKEIQQLKKKLKEEREDKVRSSKVKPEKISHSKVGGTIRSAIKIDAEKEIVDEEPIVESPKKVRRAISKHQNGTSDLKNTEKKQKKEKSPQKGRKGTQPHYPKGPLFSKITNDVAAIYSFFEEGFKTANLLYRASENEFQVATFHEKCDEKRNTLTLILTEHNKIIGGFTPLPWKSGGGEWHQDPKGGTFIFSLTTGERYPLNDKDRAIWCSKNYGPSFGFPDLEIADKSNNNANSCANFPNCFNNGNYTKTPGSLQIFCGSKSGHFKIKEWQVYELTF